MKVLLINGSPNEKRCTYTALTTVAQALEAENITTEIAWIGHDPLQGCHGCGSCFRQGTARCIFDTDIVNSLIEKTSEADGLVVGTPVFYAGANGALVAALDRMFYAASSSFHHKPAAAVASARRAGTTSALDQIYKYFQINQMPLVSSNYWPLVHGQSPEEVLQDEEGMQTMRLLGRNMAWLLKSLEAARLAGISIPETEKKIKTNFIRPRS